MDNNMTISEQKQAQLLNNGLITADRFINKNYLINIDKQNVIELKDAEKNTGSIRLYQIIKLVYDRKENVNDKRKDIKNPAGPGADPCHQKDRELPVLRVCRLGEMDAGRM